MSHEVRIRRLAAGGDGIAELPDGRVLFVPLSAPGDRMRIEVTESRRRFARGRSLELLEAGSSRVVPRCPAFGVCGGCSWQHVAYPQQLEAKQQILRDAIERIGHLELPDDAPIAMTPSPEPYHYRWRTRVLVNAEGAGYRRRQSHDLCSVTSCPVLVEPLERAVIELAKHPPRVTGPGTLAARERRATSSADTNECEEWELVAPADAQVRATSLSRGASVPVQTVRAPGAESQRLSPGVFAQANIWLLSELCRSVRAAVESVAGDAGAIELYAGAGFLTLDLARDFAELIAVEASGPAFADLRENLKRAGLDHVEAINGRVEDVLADLTGRRADAVVLDPPRTGLGTRPARSVAGLGARLVAYLSCNPATLARDLAEMCRSGYELVEIRAFDLFPQTPHVEALAVLERRS